MCIIRVYIYFVAITKHMYIQSLNGGLTHKRIYNYDIDISGRIDGSTFEREVVLCLPLFLSFNVWERYQYTFDDITTTLSFFPSILLWQLALLYDITPSHSAVKMAFSTPESLSISAKAMVIRKLEQVILETHDLQPSTSILDTRRDEHIPPIPLNTISDKQWTTLKKNIPYKDIDLINPIKLSNAFVWKDILMMPLCIEHEAIYAVRLISKKEFEESYRFPIRALANRPFIVLIGQDEYYGVEEACFFVRK